MKKLPATDEAHLRETMAQSSHKSIPDVATVSVTRTSLRGLLLHMDHMENLLQRLAECSRTDPNRRRGTAEGKWFTVNVPALLLDDILAIVGANAPKEPQ